MLTECETYFTLGKFLRGQGDADVISVFKCTNCISVFVRLYHDSTFTVRDH